MTQDSAASGSGWSQLNPLASHLATPARAQPPRAIRPAGGLLESAITPARAPQSSLPPKSRLSLSMPGQGSSVRHTPRRLANTSRQRCHEVGRCPLRVRPVAVPRSRGSRDFNPPDPRQLLDVTEGRPANPARRPFLSAPRGAHWRPHGGLKPAAGSSSPPGLSCAAAVQTVWERFRKEGQLNTDVVSRVEAEELQQRLDALQREVRACCPGPTPFPSPTYARSAHSSKSRFPMSLRAASCVCTRVCMECEREREPSLPSQRRSQAADMIHARLTAGDARGERSWRRCARSARC